MGQKNTIKIILLILFLILLIIIIALKEIFIHNRPTVSNTVESNALIENSNNSNNIVEDRNKVDEASIDTTIEDDEELDDIDKIAKDLFEKGSFKIRETHYSDYYEYKVAEPVVDKEINGNMYRKTNVLYSEIENKYAEIFTGEALKEVLNIRFTEIDGYLYVMWGGASGWGVTNIKVSKISEENNEINYLIKYNNVNVADIVELEEQSCNMTIKLVDGNYRISATDYCGLQENYYNK